MLFSYQVDLEDFREAVRSKSPQAALARPVYVLLNWLFVFASAFSARFRGR